MCEALRHNVGFGLSAISVSSKCSLQQQLGFGILLVHLALCIFWDPRLCIVFLIV